ncbi:hypothetical protein VC83_01800 [Pseudogymnoascus destructans]|uniref:CCHC-type domain-containing protein n=1 Tax=Pseudogymnoascus destructans TaxID=655981 RepID=A0A177AK07_9PEZI|nr:uncharacterized protein VC83_01800 [Pseudogymnoascus destructans]OAF61623.1 hypothetical protein VC83_01800 [Pseudogymnoascus destructans]
MVRELTAFDQELCQNKELNPLPAPARMSTRVGVEADSSHTCSVYPSHVLPKPTMLERVKTAVPASSGNCFKCGKPGHFYATIKEINHNDPEAEEQWEEAVELQWDASLEENDEA